MARKPNFRLPTDEEIAVGREKGKLMHRFDAPRFTYHPRRDVLTFKLHNGVSVEVPRSTIGYLDGLSREQLGEMRLIALGEALEVESLDLQISVQAMVQHAVGVDWARQAGLVSTPKKAEPARINSARAGRPRKKVRG